MALTRPSLAQLTTGIARIGDPIITLHAGYSSANVDIGLLMNRANGLVSNVALYWNETGNTFVTAFTSNTGETNTNISATSYASITSGHLLPGANVTYSLGTTTQRWKDLWLSGTTIYLGGATISSTDANTVSITNQSGGSFSITGAAAGQASGTFGNLIANSGIASTSTSTGALQVTGGAGISGSLYIANVGDVSANIGSYYTYANLTYNTIANAITLQNQITGSNASIVTANTAMKGYVDTQTSAVTTNWTANAATQQGLISTLQSQVYANANVSTYLPTYAGSITSLGVTSSTDSTSTSTGALTVTGGVGIAGNVWIGGTLTVANLQARGSSQIVVQDPMTYFQANVLYPWNYDTGLYSDGIGGPANIYVHHGMVRSIANGYWGFFSNVATEPVQTITWTDAGLIWDTVKAGALVLANSTTSTSTTTGALQVAGGIGVTGNAYVGTLYTTSGIRWAGNSAVISTGGGGGATYTASTTAPFGPSVGDQWYYTTGDILYEYQNVGTGSFWVDITSPTITSGNITVAGGDILSPFLLMGA